MTTIPTWGVTLPAVLLSRKSNLWLGFPNHAARVGTPVDSVSVRRALRYVSIAVAGVAVARWWATIRELRDLKVDNTIWYM